jgi:2-C-methyl-D-erythritol 4-phosphate cytidylyltransferase/2-C-methyl-D-erythritol 2,4-cyclodiphosphate synthase
LIVAALIVAAGRGSRAAAAGQPPKQFVLLGDKTVLARSIEAFSLHPRIDHVALVIHPDDTENCAAVSASLGASTQTKLLPVAMGGETRQASVRRGLTALARVSPDVVLIHDAARPFVSADTIDRVVAALADAPGAIAAVPLTDTLKRAAADGRIDGTIDRNGLWRAQTPQGFAFAAIREAHDKAHAAGLEAFTDDAALAEWAGLAVAVVPGGDRNVKLTTAEDVAMARTLFERGNTKVPRETRSASGFDVHRFMEGTSVWLCGVEIPHTARLEGHSDADVGLHALTDALLGAIGAGDIGQHFPPSDDRWKGAASHIFLRHAADLVGQRGGRIVNVDVTILAEAPRVGPHRAAMCKRIADILRIEAGRVSVKATTTEGLGFTGRREGIAAMATASVELPAGPAS